MVELKKRTAPSEARVFRSGSRAYFVGKFTYAEILYKVHRLTNRREDVGLRSPVVGNETRSAQKIHIRQTVQQ